MQINLNNRTILMFIYIAQYDDSFRALILTLSTFIYGQFDLWVMYDIPFGANWDTYLNIFPFIHCVNLDLMLAFGYPCIHTYRKKACIYIVTMTLTWDIPLAFGKIPLMILVMFSCVPVCKFWFFWSSSCFFYIFTYSWHVRKIQLRVSFSFRYEKKHTQNAILRRIRMKKKWTHENEMKQNTSNKKNNNNNEYSEGSEI